MIDRPLLNTSVIARGSRVTLRPFGPSDVHDRYLAWLSDPDVNAYSRRAGQNISSDEARTYLATLRKDELVVGIETDDHGHIGNLKYGPIDRHNQRAEISIVIGDRSAWNHGFGSEAIYLASRHLFMTEGLNRVDAGSANPAFLRMVTRLGWTIEGVLRDRVRIGDKYHDWILFALLRREFQEISAYEFNGIEHQ